MFDKQVNSTWTSGHISSLWGVDEHCPIIIFPPCDVDSFSQLSLSPRKPLILSVGQFRFVDCFPIESVQFIDSKNRPEKDHPLQLRAFSEFLQKFPKWKNSELRLRLLGSCRGAEDEKLLRNLRELASELKIEVFLGIKKKVFIFFVESS